MDGADAVSVVRPPMTPPFRYRTRLLESHDGPHPVPLSCLYPLACCAHRGTHGAGISNELGERDFRRLNYQRRIAAYENLNLGLTKLTNFRCQRSRQAVCGINVWALATVSSVSQSRIPAGSRFALAPI